MRSDRSRSRKASGIIYPHFERKCYNGTDARHRHQTTADRVMLNHLKKHAMQSFVAVEDRPPHVQQASIMTENTGSLFSRSSGRVLRSPATNASHQQPIRSQRAANVILDVDQLALEEFPVGQK
ncbi:hypothetical protein V1283_001833 [Bradyrhizobium sp. AZCC 2262]